MVRPMLPFAGLALLFGSALISGMSRTNGPTNNVPSINFVEVQQAVAQQRTVHVLFRSLAHTSSEGMNYEAWLKVSSPAFLVRTLKGQMIGDRNGVRYAGKGQPDFFLTKEPVTAAFIRQKMIVPQFEADLGQMPSIRWRAEKDVANSSLTPFVADDANVHRVLWVDETTHLPMRLDIETHGNTGSSDDRSTARIGKSYVLYFYDENSPVEINDSAKTAKTRSRYVLTNGE